LMKKRKQVVNGLEDCGIAVPNHRFVENKLFFGNLVLKS
jgi:hypothetical protein